MDHTFINVSIFFFGRQRLQLKHSLKKNPLIFMFLFFMFLRGVGGDKCLVLQLDAWGLMQSFVDGLEGIIWLILERRNRTSTTFFALSRPFEMSGSCFQQVSIFYSSKLNFFVHGGGKKKSRQAGRNCGKRIAV